MVSSGWSPRTTALVSRSTGRAPDLRASPDGQVSLGGELWVGTGWPVSPGRRDTERGSRMTAIRLVVVEDMTVLREAIVNLLSLESDMVVVGEAERGDQALSLIATLTPDIVILDLELPGMSGLAVARGIRDRKVLVLSALDRPGVVREALDAGVLGYLPKGVSIDTLIDAVRRVHRGEVVIPSALLASTMSGGRSPLTEREQVVLQLAARGDTMKDISCALNISAGTARNHLTRIRRKLSARNKIEAIRVARESGWL